MFIKAACFPASPEHFFLYSELKKKRQKVTLCIIAVTALNEVAQPLLAKRKGKCDQHVLNLART
jgi:hypothetical protein